MLQIVLDGAADLPAEWIAEYDVHILPLHVHFGKTHFVQGEGFTHAQFYQLVREQRMIPKTSLPSPGEVAEFYRALAKPGDEILSLHISSKLSGTVATIQSAANELAGELDVTVFDTLAGSATQGFMAREARLMQRAGHSLDEILARLRFIREHTQILFTLDSLEYAALSGRINTLQSMMATALQLKPVIELRDGMLEVAAKVRTRQRALEHILNLLCSRLQGHRLGLAVLHAADRDTALSLLARARQMLPIEVDFVGEVSLPVVAHLGPRAIGLVAYPLS